MTLRRVEPGSKPWPDVYDLPDVSDIVRGVRNGGDAGVRRAAALVGDPVPREVSLSEMEAAGKALDESTHAIIDGAASRIERFARAQRAALKEMTTHVGNMIAGHRVVPIERIGIYVPGGNFPLPSTVLMCAIPARIADVRHITMCTPNAGRATLAAANRAGVDACFEIGGAQAIAAMAYGTETVPKVDLIVGPGNAYVTAAKRLVFGTCGIDMLAGPSEVLVIASGDADAELVAADLLAQAEHDVLSRAMLLTDDDAFAGAVDSALARRLMEIRKVTATTISLDVQGCCAVVPLEETVEWANSLAPEHLELHGPRAEALAPRLDHFGSLFIGAGAAEVFGDYGAGPNHVLPTSGTPRFASGLSVFTFLNVRTFLWSADAVDSDIVSEAAAFARLEGLEAHRQAAMARVPSLTQP